MVVFRCLFILLIFSSCTVGTKSLKKNTEEYFTSSGAIKYFRPDIPNWANFSQSSQCLRKDPIRYFDLELLKGSFSLKDEEARQLQLLFNYDRKEAMKSRSGAYSSLEEEEEIFFKSLEKIQAGIRIFNPPNYKRVHLVWVDDFILGRKNISALRSLMDTKTMSLGHPVFVSLCLDHHRLTQWIQQFNFASIGTRALTYELASLHNSDSMDEYFFSIMIHHLFKKDQKLYFYSPRKRLPNDFLGEFIKRTF